VNLKKLSNFINSLVLLDEFKFMNNELSFFYENNLTYLSDKIKLKLLLERGFLCDCIFVSF
jgi:hypothetical protein